MISRAELAVTVIVAISITICGCIYLYTNDYQGKLIGKPEVFNYGGVVIPNYSIPKETPDIPVWSAAVDKSYYNVISTGYEITWNVNYNVDIYEDKNIRKSFNNISKEKLISVLTYYNSRYNLDSIDTSNKLYNSAYVRNYTEYMSEIWRYETPLTKYDANEFKPEYTPEPTPLPTFSSEKWYKDSIK